MDLVLQLRQDLVDQMVAHARRDHPDEACGLLVGPAGADRPERFIPMLNAARSPTFYQFDEGEWLRVYQETDAADEEIVAVFHSHTATEAYPSRTDVGIADNYAMFLPSPHYVLVSTREPDTHELRSYRIADGAVTEERVDVVESYRFAGTGPDDRPDR
ncbi:Mov34/MPN/PAD-1 family protein [Labedaea rhizosphaerae]|uniref:Proteasome lid subunit RPN8/RPN11 n=1 Tax=Labedaea rhizosphaerae TaxID=598644 RepID=A0A4V6PVT0_LABRH|nr:M67 family metallopeptidase [Labedaea rhizosphaerae]TDP96538.1 proteasome lid subunit RPN8/RPN11 [Labedaea rhizosphaerae]